MIKCELEKECDACRVGGCVFIDDEKRCPDRKFAILVMNRTVEKADKILDWIGEVVHPLDAVMQGKEKLQALKMEEE